MQKLTLWQKIKRYDYTQRLIWIELAKELAGFLGDRANYQLPPEEGRIFLAPNYDLDAIQDAIDELKYEFIEREVIYNDDCIDIISALQFYRWADHEIGPVNSINTAAYAAIYDYIEDNIKQIAFEIAYLFYAKDTDESILNGEL